ncbi:helix-turn-helix transcriptional regulator [Klenkia brasiliensis]|uniref:HTH domain-containing protein n=1 Tax=Klenkia brasiliensis TaxID=333142 RepID=A0A1G7PXJ5_9ACTN|nr:WYL domain-containing protein [Klenkia brasiliensis]SDF90976.1 HTH domain-containing protein [Klenkia brasiliensis]
MSGTPGRLLSLLSLLQSRRDWPGSLLAQRLEVSPRTVRRDVDRLRDLGYPVQATMGPDGGYRLAAGASLPPLLLDDEQAVAVALALQLSADDAAHRALATLRQVMPSRLRHRVDAVQVAAVPGRPVAQVDQEVLVAVTGAVRARQELRFDLGGAVRRTQPHAVLAREGHWYLLAWDLDRDDWRTFRLDRVTPRTPLGARFTPREVPGEDPGAFVAALFRGSRDPAEGWPCRGRVVLAAPAESVAPYLGDGTVEPLDGDRCRVSAGSWSWVGLAASLLRLDADLSHAEPAELVRAFADLGARCSAVSPPSSRAGRRPARPRSSPAAGSRSPG